MDGIDLLKDDSEEVAFPELSGVVANLWGECFKNFEDHAKKTDHPERHNFDKFENLYRVLHILNKSRMDDVKTYMLSSLEQFVFAYDQAIPFYKNAMKTTDFNPIKKFRQELKKLWQIPDVDDKDVNLKITTSSYIIFLEK